MRIVFLIHDLGPGGAERVLVHIANGLSRRGHEVSIHTLSARYGTSFYPLDSRIQDIRLGFNTLPARKGLSGTLIHVVKLVKRLRDHFRAHPPEALVAFIDTTNIFALVASIGLPFPVIISERSDPRFAPLRWIWKVARQLTYPRAASLVVQSAEVRDLFLPWIRRNTLVIPNPVLPPPGSDITGERQDPVRRILAVGRLGPEKGFDILLQAFTRLAPRFPGWELEIRGEGTERMALEALRGQLGLEDKVRLPGTTPEIHSRYAQADVFVLSSRFEGFPNVLCEAMSHGLPAVATSCSGGVRDIIRPGVDGLLVPPEDPAALAEALATLMGDASMRATLGGEARRVVQRFDLEHILDSWEQCLRQAQRGDT